VNVFEAGIAALAVCFATGLPGDWARRREVPFRHLRRSFLISLDYGTAATVMA